MSRLLTVFLSLFLLNCSDIYVNDIDVDYTTTALVPGFTPIAGLDIPTPSLTELGFDEFTQFDINASQAFKDKVGSVSKVTFINLQTFELETTDPELSIDFLDKVSFYISIANGPERLLAHLDSVPLNSNRVLLDVDRSLDLTPYIKSENITIRTEVIGTIPNVDTELTANLIFLVDTTHNAFYN